MRANMPFVTVSSVTYAIKGRDVLRNNGIKAYIERTPRGYSNEGCGYSIYFDADHDSTVELLKNAGIKLKQRGGAL